MVMVLGLGDDDDNDGDGDDDDDITSHLFVSYFMVGTVPILYI